MEWESIFMLMGILTKENLKMVKLKELEFLGKSMVQFSKVNGKIINFMGRERKLGMMGYVMRETIQKGSNMGWAFLVGVMDHLIKENLGIIVCKDKELTHKNQGKK